MRTWIANPLAGMPPGAEAGLVIEGQIIAELIPPGQSPTTPVHQTFDASQHVILPGLINTHHHVYQTLTRAHPDAINKKLFDWLIALYPVWARLTEQDFRAACRLAFAELLLSGCTTVSDHHYVFPKNLPNAIDIEMQEAQSLGIRAVLCRGSMDLSVEDGGLPPKSITQSIDTILADGERLAATWHDPAPGAMTQLALAPCSPFSVTGDLMRETAAQSARLSLRLHTHLAETEDENAFCQAKFNKRPLDYLEDLNWLTPRTWFAHGIHFSAPEMTRMAATGCCVAHCPTSNMILGSGICPVSALESAGVGVGLGVDGSASNDASNLIQELRQAMLLQRVRNNGDISAATHQDPIRWATQGSARCLGRPDLGRLDVGAQADLALFKLDEPRFSGAGDPVAALITCGAHRADRVMVAGHWRVIDAAIPGLDLPALIATHTEAAHRLRCA